MSEKEKKPDKRKGRALVRGKRATTVNENARYLLADAFELFHKTKQAEGMRERTLKDYTTHWRYFIEWVNESHPEIWYVDQLVSAILREYVFYMSGERSRYEGDETREQEGVALSPTTVSIRLRTLKTMCRFWSNERIIDMNPAQHIKPPKQDEEEIPSFTDEQLRLLLQQPNTDSFAGFRDKVLMCLLADTGLRINEAMALDIGFFDVKNKIIYLPAAINKNRKPRMVPVSIEIMRMVLELVNENKAFFNEGNRLFLTSYGDALDSYTVRKNLTKYGKKAGIHEDVRVSPHTFRHYFCKTYLLNGGDIFTLQKIVGHADIATTRKYIQMDDADIRQQHTQFSPISRLGLHRAGRRKK